DGDLLDGPIEGSLVGARWSRGTAQLPDELDRGGADLVIGGRRREIGERLDISAHRSILQLRPVRTIHSGPEIMVDDPLSNGLPGSQSVLVGRPEVDAGV